MMGVASHNFKNSPIITAELTKFLALNTNVESIDQVEKQINTLLAENVTLKKEVKNATSAAATASNKWDSTYKSIVEDLKKRVRQLEKTP